MELSLQNSGCNQLDPSINGKMPMLIVVIRDAFSVFRHIRVHSFVSQINQFGTLADIQRCQAVISAIEPSQFRAHGKIKRSKLVIFATERVQFGTRGQIKRSELVI